MLLKYEAQSKKLGFFVFSCCKKRVFVATMNIFYIFLHFFTPTPCTEKIKFIPLLYQMQKITEKKKKKY